MLNLKKYISTMALASISVLLASCGSSSSTPSANRIASTVTYTVTFKANWNITTHPTNFPIKAHFSPLIGAMHKSKDAIWARGSSATAGVKLVAEEGKVGTIVGEIEQLQKTGEALDAIQGSSGQQPNVGTIIATFSVNSSHPYASVITMLAPSPDWFTGVNSVKLTTMTVATTATSSTIKWVTPVSAVARVYDAGTDSGETFTAADAPNEDALITRLTDTTNTNFNG